MLLFRKLWFIIVLVAVLGIGFVVAGEMNWLPLPKISNLFGKSEVKIADTPLEVKEVKDIGELICAEFYGEVYADLNDAYRAVFEEYKQHIETYGDTLGIYRDSMFTDFPLLKNMIDKRKDIEELNKEFQKKSEEFKAISNEYLTKKAVYDSIRTVYDSVMVAYKKGQEEYIENKRNFNIAIDELRDKERDFSRQIRKLKRRNKEDEVEQMQESKANIEDNIKQYIDLLNENLDRWQATQKSTNEMKEVYKRYEREYNRIKNEYDRKKDGFNNFKEDYEEEIEERTSMDKKLVYIGRGWVKAGFDLTNFEPDDIEVNKSSDTTNLILHVNRPKILVTDINPWFIKTKKTEIEGYEIFMKKGSDRKFTNAEQVKVKSVCKDKLREEAVRKGILNNAETSGEETLIQFFQLFGIENITIKYKEDNNTKLAKQDG